MTQKTSKKFTREIEQVKGWEAEFEALVKKIEPRFARSEAKERAKTYLKGLLSSVERKNSWQMAEEARDENPYGIQHLLGRAMWDANGLRDDLREYVLDNLEALDGVGIFDETGFLKKGNFSVGVQRQYSGTAGKVENCQIGVFLAYASSKGQAFLDRELYLPESWASDRDRRPEARVPDQVKFATKPELAIRMWHRARKAGMIFAWITADTVYGNSPVVRQNFERERQAYVLGIPSTEIVKVGWEPLMVDYLATKLSPDEWVTHSASPGSKRPRIDHWAVVPIAEKAPMGWQKWVLFRRSHSPDRELSYYRVMAPEFCSLVDFVRVAGSRWRIEECFESAKGEVGLDHYEVRSWTGWYRHITLACLAHAFLSVMRSRGLTSRPQKGGCEPPIKSTTDSMQPFKRQRGLC